MKRLIILLVLIISCLGVYAQASFDLVQFSDSTKYGWADWRDRKDYRNDLLARQKLLHIYEMEAQSIRSNVVKSAIIPGWGQFSTKHYTRGQAILGAELILFGTSLYFYDKSMDYYRKYEAATQIDDIDSYYKKAQGPYQYAVIFLGLGMIIWSYNLFDVVQSTEAYNETVWDRIYKEFYDSGIQIGVDGIGIRF